MSAKHPPGRGSQLTPDERRQIQCLAFVDGLSISEIARQTGRDRGTLAGILKADDSQAFEKPLETEAKDAAVKILRGTAERAARSWGTAIGVAADKGDHRPAKDLLLHTGVIDPIPDGAVSGTRIAIIIGTPEHPIRVSPPQGVVVEPL